MRREEADKLTLPEMFFVAVSFVVGILLGFCGFSLLIELVIAAHG